MKYPSLPFTVTDWSGVEPSVHPGEKGQALWRTFKLTAGMSYQVSDFGDAAHRSSTTTGAKLFIVD